MNFFRNNPKVAFALGMGLLLFACMKILSWNKPPKLVSQMNSEFLDSQLSQAKQLADVLDDGSKVVILDFERDSEFNQVYRAVEKAGLDVVHKERLVLNEEAGWDINEAGFPYFEYLRVAESYPNVDGIIAFCGSPYFTPEEKASDPSGLPKLLIAGGEFGSAAEFWFNRGKVHAATVLRANKDGEPPLFELLSKQ